MSTRGSRRTCALIKVAVGEPLLQHGMPVTERVFPNGGVSVTNQMKDGSLVEVATVGTEGMLGVAVFLGDLTGSGTSLQQVPKGRCRPWRFAASSSM